MARKAKTPPKSPEQIALETLNAIAQALEVAGGAGYLARLSRTDPPEFLKLLQRLVPTGTGSPLVNIDQRTAPPSGGLSADVELARKVAFVLAKGQTAQATIEAKKRDLIGSPKSESSGDGFEQFAVPVPLRLPQRATLDGKQAADLAAAREDGGRPADALPGDPRKNPNVTDLAGANSYGGSNAEQGGAAGRPDVISKRPALHVGVPKRYRD